MILSKTHIPCHGGSFIRDHWFAANAILVISLMTLATLPPGTALGIFNEPLEFVVGFHSFPLDIQQGGALLGGTVPRVDITLRFAVIETRAPAFLVSLSLQDRNVRYVEPNGVGWLSFIPNDPCFDEAFFECRGTTQYGPQLIKAPEAWDVHQGSTDVEVCVVDTGVCADHPDLNDGRFISQKSRNFIGDPENLTDNNGHGTMVTGIIAATINNGVGIAGLAQVSFYAAKITEGGTFTEDNLAAAIRHCADQGADIINLSVRIPDPHSAVAEAVAYAYTTKGSLLVGAAGNQGSNQIDYPARYPGVIAATCVDQGQALCSFSNFGPEAELAGPGNEILSTGYRCYPVNGETICELGYEMRDGTSFSAPHVSGVAALMKSRNPPMTNIQIREQLNLTASHPESLDWDEKYGYGIVDAYAAFFREASLSGTVWDQATGQPLAAVEVAVQGSITLTDADGQYSFPELLTGTYTVQFTHPMYVTETRTTTLLTGANTLNVSMQKKSPGGPPPAGPVWP